ncbi:MAG: LysR family transcriptional regulator [Pigmentiphaga sp.]|nr:LysR family transcriptional regulator [Pigmentiphaga sp.]
MPDFLLNHLGNLKLLRVLSQTRSFTQTAKRLGLSKASVSTRINELEKHIGLPLVRRTTRSVDLTEAGLQLVMDSELPLDRIEQSIAQVKDLSGQPRGVVRVTAPVALGRQVLTPMLAPFIRSFPEVQLEVELTDRFINLPKEGFDLAIRHAESLPDTHIAWKLCASRSLLVASKDYLHQHTAPDHPSGLVEHPCLLYRRDQRSTFWTFEHHAAADDATNTITVSVDGPLKANNSEVLRDAARDGLGIALLPDFSAWQDVEKGLLQIVLPDWTPKGYFAEGLYAIRPWSAALPRAVQCFVDHLRANFSQPGFVHFRQTQ